MKYIIDLRKHFIFSNIYFIHAYWSSALFYNLEQCDLYVKSKCFGANWNFKIVKFVKCGKEIRHSAMYYEFWENSRIFTCKCITLSRGKYSKVSEKISLSFTIFIRNNIIVYLISHRDWDRADMKHVLQVASPTTCDLT